MGESEDIESFVKCNDFNRGLSIFCLNINILTAHIDKLRVFEKD